MTGRVEGKVAFITGAARGQGRSKPVEQVAVAKPGHSSAACVPPCRAEDTMSTALM